MFTHASFRGQLQNLGCTAKVLARSGARSAFLVCISGFLFEGSNLCALAGRLARLLMRLGQQMSLPLQEVYAAQQQEVLPSCVIAEKRCLYVR